MNIRSKTFHGWYVTAAAFTLAVFGWGMGFYGPPIYLHAIRETRGWSLSLVSSAITLHFLFGALVVANLTKLHQRFRVGTVTKVGIVSLAGGITGWAMAEQPWQLFAATLLSGAGWAATGAAAINAIVAPWFFRARPAALATAYNGASVGGIIFSPLWVAAIEFLGFSTAAAAIGVIAVVTVWILADLFFTKTPQQMGLTPDGDRPESTATVTAACAPGLPGSKLWKDVRFITLSLGMALGLFAQIGLLAHLFSLLAPALGVQLAGAAAGAATAAAIAGRTLVGWLMPARADRRLIACASYLVQILGSAAFLFSGGNSVSFLLIGVVLFGAGIGNATSLPPLIAQLEFAKEDVARVVSLIVAISQASYAFAPAAFGLIRELAPNGGAVESPNAPYLFLAAGLIQFGAIATLLAGRTRHAVSK